jgi:hypothetical protein
MRNKQIEIKITKWVLGILSSYRTALAIRPLLAALELEQLSRLLPEQKTRGAVATAIATTEVLKAGGVRQTSIITHSSHALSVFSVAADHQDICVTSQQLFASRYLITISYFCKSLLYPIYLEIISTVKTLLDSELQFIVFAF